MGELTAAGPAVSGPTASALREGRERFNALFAAARHTRPGLSADTLLAHLARFVPPVVKGAEHARPGSAGEVTEALYEASLDLLVHGSLGTLDAVFASVLPAVAPVLVRSPREVAAAMCNAALQVAGVAGARLDQWCALVVAAAGAAGCEQLRVPGAAEVLTGELGASPGAPAGVTWLLDAGLVAAWRAGLAHARAAALDAAARLPAPVAAAALGLPAPAAGDLEGLGADRWWLPGAGAGGERGLAVVARVGSFRGFGGEFLEPPRVVGAAAGVFAVEGGTGRFWLHADAFGATLRRSAAGAPLDEPPAHGFHLADEGTVTLDGWDGALTVPALAGASTWAVAGGTLAATTPRSHAVMLVARSSGGAPA